MLKGGTVAAHQPEDTNMQTAKDLLLKSAESAEASAARLEKMVDEGRAQVEADTRAALSLRGAANEYRAAAAAAAALPK